MRVIVVGATGNVGTSLLRALADEPAVDEVLGVARRRPSLELPKVEWAGIENIEHVVDGGVPDLEQEGIELEKG